MRPLPTYTYVLALLIVLSTVGGTVRAEKAAAAGFIEGSLSVTAPPRREVKPAADYDSINPYGATAYDATPRKAAKPLPEEIVVYLEEVPGNWAPPMEHVKLDQKFTQFTHRVLPVLAGTTVDFTNHDPIYHNVFSNSDINSFDLGRRQKGEKASAKMRRLEIPVRVFCEIHSNMKSNILVLQNPFFTVVQPGGSFRLEGIPPGTYQLAAWHDFWQPIRQAVTVTAGAATKVQLTLTKTQQ